MVNFVSVVPAIRSPFGVDVFDYSVDADADMRPGDIIRVPFRKRSTSALVVSVMPTSPFADRAVRLTSAEPLIRLPAWIVPLLDRTAARTFSSRPTVLRSWLRNVPQRARPAGAVPPSIAQTRADISAYSLDRFSDIRERIAERRGRTLILTPWQQRADRFARDLGCSCLHADLSAGAAWTAWTAFATSAEATLVSTRIGGWLACVADTVVIDEPENDDHKQDELAPRTDARRIVEIMNDLHPSLSVIRIGTTPRLADIDPNEADELRAPTINLPIEAETLRRETRSAVENLTSLALTAIESAVEDHHAAIIIHPISGERGRIVCRDCRWAAVCAFCGFGLNREADAARCRRCGRRSAVPFNCPQCGGADLARSRVGRDRLGRLLADRFPGADIRVLDLPDWNRSSLPRGATVIVTDISLIGGGVEDVSRREHLIITFRRLAAAIASAGGSLLIQGDEQVIGEAPTWLTQDGLRAAWQREWAERKAFGYPPASSMAKLLVDGSADNAEQTADRLRQTLPAGWEVRGPFPVPFRSKTRSERHVLQIIPPAGATEADLTAALEPFAKTAIIDLDPIAFFG